MTKKKAIYYYWAVIMLTFLVYELLLKKYVSVWVPVGILCGFTPHFINKVDCKDD